MGFCGKLCGRFCGVTVLIMTGEEIIHLIVLQATNQPYGRTQNGWIAVELPSVPARELSLYIKEAGNRGLLDVRELTNHDSQFDEWAIRGITALGLQSLESGDLSPRMNQVSIPKQTKFGYGFLLVGWGLFYLIDRLLGIGAIYVAAICTVAGIAFLIAGHSHEKGPTASRIFAVTAIVGTLIYFGYVSIRWWGVPINIPKPYVPTHRNWAAKLEEHTTTITHAPETGPPTKIPQSMPPPLHHRDQFLTNVMLYNDSSKVYCASSIGAEIRQASCGDMQNIFKGPNENQDAFTSLSILLQHELVGIVFAAGQEWGSHGETDQAIYQKVFAPIDPPDVYNYRPHDVVRVSRKDLPLFPFDLNALWNEPRMRLPRGTEVVLVKLPTENNGPEIYAVRLERTGYFKIDIGVKQHEAFQAGQTPAEYHMGPLGLQTGITTYTFLVSVEWAVERSHDTTFLVEDYDHWAKELADRIRERLIN